jgi:hypothetical protein
MSRKIYPTSSSSKWRLSSSRSPVAVNLTSTRPWFIQLGICSYVRLLDHAFPQVCWNHPDHQATDERGRGLLDWKQVERIPFSVLIFAQTPSTRDIFPDQWDWESQNSCTGENRYPSWKLFTDWIPIYHSASTSFYLPHEFLLLEHLHTLY